MVKQTAGRDALNDFAPKFAQLNDDVLFGEVWSREDKLSLKTRSIVTITSPHQQGNCGSFPKISSDDCTQKWRDKN